MSELIKPSVRLYEDWGGIVRGFRDYPEYILEVRLERNGYTQVFRKTFDYEPRRSLDIRDTFGKALQEIGRMIEFTHELPLIEFMGQGRWRCEDGRTSEEAKDETPER